MITSRRRFSPSVSVAFLGVVALSACNSGSDAAKPSGATCATDSTVTYDGFVAPFMTKYCNDCHGSSVMGANREGAPSDHDLDTLESVLEGAAHIDEQAAAGADRTNDAMPPSGEKPTLEERKKLGEWIACQVEAGNEGEHDHGDGHSDDDDDGQTHDAGEDHSHDGGDDHTHDAGAQ